MECEIINDFCDSLRRTGMHPDTIEDYRRGIDCFIAFLSKEKVFSLFAAQRHHIAGYYLSLTDQVMSSSTRYKKSRAVYALFEYLRESGYILLNPCPKPLRKSNGMPRTIPGRDSLQNAYRRLRRSIKPFDMRDYLLMDMAYSCGLRRCELHRLNVGDISANTGTIKVRGKGSHERVVPLGRQTLRNVNHYLYHVRPKLMKAGNVTNALFVSWNNGGKRMHLYSINAVFHRLRKRFGFDRSITPHSLRHAFATDLIRNGAPVQDVSKMLGHRKLETTQVYTRLMPNDLRKCHARYHPRG